MVAIENIFLFITFVINRPVSLNFRVVYIFFIYISQSIVRVISPHVGRCAKVHKMYNKCACAVLRAREFIINKECVCSSAGEGSVAEGGGVAWGGEAGDERRYAALMERLHHHQAERGTHTAHVQLRYAPQAPLLYTTLHYSVKVTPRNDN